MSIAAADSPSQIIAIEDANVYQIQTGITTSMSNTAGSQSWGFVAGTFKSSNPVSPPLISEAFSNIAASVGGIPYMYEGESATVSFTVTNTNSSSSLSGIVFSDTLPVGMVVATPNGVSGSCPGGTVDAAEGTGTISLSGASLSAAASCTFSVNVRCVAAGNGVNTTGNVTAAESRNGGTATATVRMYGPSAISISNITVKAIDHGSVNITYSTGIPGFCQLQFGLASGALNNRAGRGWVDASRSDISSYLQSLWPSSDNTSRFPCSGSDTNCSGGTLASRLSAVGWSATMNLAGGNPNPYAIVPSRYNPGNLGANVTAVNQATGVVQGITVSKSPTALTFSYAAPDIRACSVDISSDGNAWARMTDSGGAFSRSLTFASLAANTTYQYRIMCYFDQSAAYEFLSSQITSGTVTTATNVTTTVFQTFTLPTGASKAVFTFAAPNGSIVNQTCSSSPCSVSLTAGNWKRTLTFETDNLAAVGTTAATKINIP